MFYIKDTGKFEGKTPPEHYKFKYKPDDFQLHGFDAINKNHNILVTAHTGAGKTSLALYGIAKWLKENKQVIYTSPIKTLSNQKFNDFSKDFDDVGIMTGDVKINPSANLLIMTAEILRNSLIRKNNDTVYEWNFNPEDVKCVILDEVHFINDPNRGMVWEEIIVNLPSNIQLIMLSATINGAMELATWVGSIKKVMCHHIPTPFRPVPLKHYIFYNNNKHLLLEGDRKWNHNMWTNICKNINNKIKKKEKIISPNDNFHEFLTYLSLERLMPTTIFILSRKNVEKTANNIRYNFNDNNEMKQVILTWNKHLSKYKSTYSTTYQWNMIKKLVEKGIGIHHSGLIPILKDMVEILYSMKLIKVLIATETFAMGVNMPTKSTVFMDLIKFDGNGKRFLKTDEYIQMAGRAGRRGIDTFGEVFILPNLKDLPKEKDLKKMMLSLPKKITSKVSIDYNYILKQLLKYDNSNIYDLLLKNINMTYFSKEIYKMNESDRLQIIEKKKELDNITVDSDEYDIYIGMMKLKEKIKSSGYRSSQKKKMRRQLNNMNSKLKLTKSITNKYHIENEYSILKNNYEFNKNIFRNMIDILLDFLKKNKMLDVNNNYTPIGRIIAEINECNPLILGNMILNNFFDDLKFEEIMAVLSIFIADRTLEEQYISDLPISYNLQSKMNNLQKTINKFIEDEEELNYNLPIKFYLDWELSTGMFNAIYYWSKGKDWKFVSQYYNSFEGNFIKNVLRLTNLVKNLYNIANIMKNVKLLNILEDYEEKLIRDFVTVDSLYL